MQIEIMETVAKNGKPIWDSLVAIGGLIGFFLQSTLAIEVMTWLQAFMFLGLGIFGLIRAYYWLRNDGYEEERP